MNKKKIDERYNYQPNFLEQWNKWFDDECKRITRIMEGKENIPLYEIHATIKSMYIQLLDEVRVSKVLLSSLEYQETLLSPVRTIIKCQHDKEKCMFKEVTK